MMTVRSQNAISVFQDARTASVYNLDDARMRSGASQGRAVVTWYRSQWVKSLEKRLNELTSLPKGWNGYRSVPVSFSSATFAANLLERICAEGLPPPQLVPGTDGTLQLEWHRAGFDIEVDVLGPNEVVATRVCVGTGEEETLHLENDFTTVAAWMNDLAQVGVELATASA